MLSFDAVGSGPSARDVDLRPGASEQPAGSIGLDHLESAFRSHLDRLGSRRITVLNRSMEVYPSRVAAPTAILADQGFDVRQTDDAPLSAAPGEIVVVWGNAVWFRSALRSLEEMHPSHRPTVVIWHAEPLPLPRASAHRWPWPRPRELAKIVLRDARASDVYSNYWRLQTLVRKGIPDVLAVTTRERAAFLAERGIESSFVPYGYEHRDGRDLGLLRDLDVLFLGTLEIRRRRQAVRRLRKAGIRVVAKGDYHDPSSWGESRTRLVNRARIILSIARFPGALAGKRFLIGMACNALVVSDPLNDSTPYIPGTHFVEASLDDMADVIQHYLANDAERRRIAQQGHDFVTSHLTMERSVSQLLGIIGEQLARR